MELDLLETKVLGYLVTFCLCLYLLPFNNYRRQLELELLEMKKVMSLGSLSVFVLILSTSKHYTRQNRVYIVLRMNSFVQHSLYLLSSHFLPIPSSSRLILADSKKYSYSYTYILLQQHFLVLVLPNPHLNPLPLLAHYDRRFKVTSLVGDSLSIKSFQQFAGQISANSGLFR